jgi:hypothetical protein
MVGLKIMSVEICGRVRMFSIGDDVGDLKYVFTQKKQNNFCLAANFPLLLNWLFSFCFVGSLNNINGTYFSKSSSNPSVGGTRSPSID